MFEKLQDKWQQLQMLQKLMKDEHFKAFLSHPKVQAAFQDPALQQALKSQDMAKIAGHPKLLALMRDPEVAPLLAKLNPQDLIKENG